VDRVGATTGEAGTDAAPSWFAVADAVADDLVPERADWVVMHVRTRVLDVVRAGVPGTLEKAGIGTPVDGEPLSLIVLRHRDPDLEVALHGLVQALEPRVGDPYGSGRVTATGRSRLATSVDPAHLRAIATGPDNLRTLQQLDVGSALVVPVVADGTVLGALNLAWSDRARVSGNDLADAEEIGARIGSALDSARPATARLRPAEPQRTQTSRWRPPAEGNPVAAARAWARQVLPEVVSRPPRESLPEDLDLVLSELVGNALRHAGGVRGVTLARRDGCLRVTVLDDDDRPPTLREPDLERESGRGLLLVEALSEAWGVDHDLVRGGKGVWSDLAM
jgi:anti-sigma regulatory factor (Ser/Thr protein kinase)